MSTPELIMRRRWASLSVAQRATITAQVEAARSAVRLRKWSLTTERCYCAWIRRYGVWLALSPDARAAADSTDRTHPSTRGVHVRASVEALAIA